MCLIRFRWFRGFRRLCVAPEGRENARIPPLTICFWHVLLEQRICFSGDANITEFSRLNIIPLADGFEDDHARRMLTSRWQATFGIFEYKAT